MQIPHEAIILYYGSFQEVFAKKKMSIMEWLTLSLWNSAMDNYQNHGMTFLVVLLFTGKAYPEVVNWNGQRFHNANVSCCYPYSWLICWQ